MDDDIMLSVDLDISDALSTADTLQQRVESIFKGKATSSKGLAILQDLKRTIQATDELRERLAAVMRQREGLASTPITYSDDYAEMQRQLQEIEVAYDNLMAQHEQFVARGLGGSAVDQQTLQMLEQLDEQFAQVIESMAQMEEEGTDLVPTEATQAFQELVAQEEALRGQIDANNDRVKLGIVKYRELGQSGGNAGKVISASFAAIKQSVTKTLGLMPKLVRHVRSITKDIKRSVITIAGVILGVRGLMSIFNKVRSSILAGFKDIYNQDKQFKTQIDTIKQKILDIQVAFAKALMPVIQMALPYIKQLLDWVMSLLGVLTRFISTITGIKAYTKAIKGLGGAAASTNKQLSKLDELNNLTSDSGNGLTPLNSSIGDSKKVDDWFEFVRRIINNIEDLLNSIPWDKVKEKARKFGKTIADIINAIAKPSFWGTVARTIAEALNTALEFFYELGKDIHWQDIGESIFEFIANFLDTFDFGKLADTIDVWVQGIWEAITTAFKSKDKNGETIGDKIIKAIKTFTEHLDVGTIKIAATSLVLLGAPILAATLGKSVAGLIGQAISQNLKTQLASGALFGAGGIVGGSSGVSMGTQATTAIGTTGGASALGALSAAVATFTGVYELVVGLGEAIALIMPGDTFMGLTDDEWAAANPIYKIFDKAKFEGFFMDFFDNLGLDKAILWLEDRFANFKGAFASPLAFIQYLMYGDQEIGPVKACNDFFTELGTNIGEKLGEVITNVSNTIAPYFTAEKWTEIFSVIGTVFETIWQDAIDFWNGIMSDWWNENVAPFFDDVTWEELLSVVPTAFASAFKSAANSVISILNTLIDAVSLLINDGALAALNGLIGAANLLPDVNLPTITSKISIPHIPALATGAVIPPNSPFMAMLGDQKNGTNIEAPLDTIKQAVREVLQETGGSRADVHVHVDIDGREIAKAVVKQNDIYKKSTGRSLLAY